MLAVLGQNISDGPLSRTAAEVAEAYQALLDPGASEVEIRCDSGGSQELVVTVVPFFSLCPHLCPLRGFIHFGYLPVHLVVDSTGVGSIVDHFAHRLQTPTRLAAEIADWSEEHLRPRGVGVLVRVDRGLCIAGCGTRTGRASSSVVATRGLLRDSDTRGDFIALADGGSSAVR